MVCCLDSIVLPDQTLRCAMRRERNGEEECVGERGGCREEHIT
jgi:hypothetical protein